PAGRPMAAPPRPAGGPAPPPDREPRQLVVTAGSHQGTRIPLGGQAITIGRSEDSTLVLDDEYVSTRHARFSQRGGVWYLDDLGSTNGTFIGATRVTQPVPAPIGAPIRIGTTVLELRP
ncbi:MAG: FHA domain-containing protein FhaB/FipA, partial [Mycobacteriales bacterium]